MLSQLVRIHVLVASTQRLLHFANPSDSALCSAFLPSVRETCVHLRAKRQRERQRKQERKRERKQEEPEAAIGLELHVHVGVDAPAYTSLDGVLDEMRAEYADTIDSLALHQVDDRQTTGESGQTRQAQPQHMCSRTHIWNELMDELAAKGSFMDADATIVVLVDDSARMSLVDWPEMLCDRMVANHESALLLPTLVPLQMTRDEFVDSQDELVAFGPLDRRTHAQDESPVAEPRPGVGYNSIVAQKSTFVALNIVQHWRFFGRHKFKFRRLSTLLSTYALLDAVVWPLEDVVSRASLTCWFQLQDPGERARTLAAFDVALARWPRESRANLEQYLANLVSNGQFCAAHYAATRMLHGRARWKNYKSVALKTLQSVWQQCEPSANMSTLLL